MCMPPLLAGCGGAPRMSGLGDGFCWYRDSEGCAEATVACRRRPPARRCLFPIIPPAYASAHAPRRCCQVRRALSPSSRHSVASSSSPTRRADTKRGAWLARRTWRASCGGEAAAAQIAAAGGCPNASARCRRATRRAPSVLDSAAACRACAPELIALNGGLDSATADAAYSFDEIPRCRRPLVELCRGGHRREAPLAAVGVLVDDVFGGGERR